MRICAGPATGLAAILMLQPALGQTTLRHGQAFATAHAQLASAGYRPYRVLQPGSELYHRNIFSRDDVFRRYPDVVSCAGTGLGDCIFVLTRGPGDILVVHTTGEEAGTLAFDDLRHATRAQADSLYR